MKHNTAYKVDITTILSKRRANGADLWTRPDRNNRQLAKMNPCLKGNTSEPATRRFAEIKKNIAR